MLHVAKYSAKLGRDKYLFVSMMEGDQQQRGLTIINKNVDIINEDCGYTITPKGHHYQK